MLGRCRDLWPVCGVREVDGAWEAQQAGDIVRSPGAQGGFDGGGFAFDAVDDLGDNTSRAVAQMTWAPLPESMITVGG